MDIVRPTFGWHEGAKMVREQASYSSVWLLTYESFISVPFTATTPLNQAMWFVAKKCVLFLIVLSK